MAGVEEEGIPCNASFIVWEGGSSFSRACVMIECEQRSSIIARHILPTNAPVTHVHFRREQMGKRPRPSPDVHEIKLSSQESPIIGIDSQRRSIAYSDVYAKDIETGVHVGNLHRTALGSIPNLDHFFFSSAHSFKTSALLPGGSKTSDVQPQWKRMQLDENEENTALLDGQGKFRVSEVGGAEFWFYCFLSQSYTLPFPADILQHHGSDFCKHTIWPRS